MKNKKQLALAVSLAVLGGTALTTQSLAAEVATPSKANELQAGNYVYVTNAISVGTATNSTVGNVDNGTQTYSVEVGYSEDKSATDETLAINVDNVNNKVTGAMATGYGASDTGLLANANGVKELVIAGMLLASRDITGGIDWVKANKEDAGIAKSCRESKKSICRN